MNITYIQISFSFGTPKDKFQVTSFLRFYSHNLSFLMTTFKIFLESLLTILMLIWIFFFFWLILQPPRTWNPGSVPAWECSCALLYLPNFIVKFLRRCCGGRQFVEPRKFLCSLCVFYLISTYLLLLICVLGCYLHNTPKCGLNIIILYK